MTIITIIIIITAMALPMGSGSMDAMSWRQRHLSPGSQTARRVAGLVGLTSTTRQRLSPWHTVRFEDDIRTGGVKERQQQQKQGDTDDDYYHRIGAMLVDSSVTDRGGGGGDCSVLVAAAYHAREPGTTQVAVEFMRALLHRLRAVNATTATSASPPPPLSACDFAVVWNANPSGYHKLWQEHHNGSEATTKAAAWRKNARGVDVYRNFPSWTPRKGGAERDNDPLSQTYRGKGAGTAWSSAAQPEEETRALMDLSVDRKVRLALCLHSSGDVVFVPNRGDQEEEEGQRLLLDEGRRLARQMSAWGGSSGQAFGVMPSLVSGTHAEYLVTPGYEHHADAVAFTLELFSRFFPSEHEVTTLAPRYAAGMLAYVWDHAERQAAAAPRRRRQCDGDGGGFDSYQNTIADVWPRRHGDKTLWQPQEEHSCAKSCQFYSAHAVLKLAQIHEFYVHGGRQSSLQLQQKPDKWCRWQPRTYSKLCRYTEALLNKEVTTRFGSSLLHRTWLCGARRCAAQSRWPRLASCGFS